jgi:SpoVK/Ycf46/Vps4 family AAA+-type ATPase
VPDKFIILKVSEEASMKKLKENLLNGPTTLIGDELITQAKECLSEYDLHMRGVNDAYKQFIFEFDAIGKPQSDVANELGKMLKLRFKSNAPRRPPRVLLLGPPGSGCQT